MNYVAMTPEGRIFDNSLAKNSPYFIRVGTGQVMLRRAAGTLCDPRSTRHGLAFLAMTHGLPSVHATA